MSTAWGDAFAALLTGYMTARGQKRAERKEQQRYDDAKAEEQKAESRRQAEQEEATAMQIITSATDPAMVRSAEVQLKAARAVLGKADLDLTPFVDQATKRQQQNKQAEDMGYLQSAMAVAGDNPAMREALAGGLAERFRDTPMGALFAPTTTVLPPKPGAMGMMGPPPAPAALLPPAGWAQAPQDVGVSPMDRVAPSPASFLQQALAQAKSQDFIPIGLPAPQAKPDFAAIQQQMATEQKARTKTSIPWVQQAKVPLAKEQRRLKQTTEQQTFENFINGLGRGFSKEAIDAVRKLAQGGQLTPDETAEVNKAADLAGNYRESLTAKNQASAAYTLMKRDNYPKEVQAKIDHFHAQEQLAQKEYERRVREDASDAGHKAALLSLQRARLRLAKEARVEASAAATTELRLRWEQLAAEYESTASNSYGKEADKLRGRAESARGIAASIGAGGGGGGGGSSPDAKAYLHQMLATKDQSGRPLLSASTIHKLREQNLSDDQIAEVVRKAASQL